MCIGGKTNVVASAAEQGASRRPAAARRHHLSAFEFREISQRRVLIEETYLCGSADSAIIEQKREGMPEIGRLFA